MLTWISVFLWFIYMVFIYTTTFLDANIAPSYLISKMLVKKLNSLLNLQNHYNVKDSTKLANNLINLQIYENHRPITFDIKDIYFNIPIRETLRFARKYLITENDKQRTEQIITLLHVILQQNCFTFGNCQYHPEKGVSMGSPLSVTIAEILLHDIENTYIKHILDTQTITF